MISKSVYPESLRDNILRFLRPQDVAPLLSVDGFMGIGVTGWCVCGEIKLGLLETLVIVVKFPSGSATGQGSLNVVAG